MTRGTLRSATKERLKCRATVNWTLRRSRLSPTDKYKKYEHEVVFRLKQLLRGVWRVISTSIRSFVRTGKQHFTVMLIPHSEKKIFNFKISVFSIALLAVLLTAMILSLGYFTTHLTGISEMLSSRTERLQSAEASLEAVRDQIYEVRKAASVFLAELENTSSDLGLQNDRQRNRMEGAEGDLASFFALEEQDEGIIRELAELKNLTDAMLSSVDTLKDIGHKLDTQRKLLEELPTLWPVPGRIRITNYFGFAEHPIEGGTYLHKGIDIGKAPGAPILAAANGKVIEKGFQVQGFGHYLVIKHIAGFSTKYAHLDQVYVKEGDTVVQGQKIGTMGDTGLSTGHHLHFEIRLGSEVKDPLTYLRLKDSANVISTVR